MRYAVAAISLGLAAASWGTPAAAHGPPPFIIGVAAADASGPTLLVATEGLVQRRDGAWIYVCPSRFGSDPSPPALSVDGQRTYVSGADGLYALEADGQVVTLGVPELARGSVVQLVSSQGAVFGVRFSDIQSEIRSVDGSAPLWTAFEPVQVAHGDDDGFWLGSLVSDTVAVVHVDPSGTEDDRRTFPVESGEAMTVLRPHGDDVYVGLVGLQFDTRLLRITKDGTVESVLDSTEPLRGLAPRGDQGLWTSTGGQLFAAGPGGSSLTDTPQSVTCVGSAPALDFACAGTQLLALATAGSGAVLADLADIQGPTPALEDPAAQQACDLEWATFHDDLAKIDVLSPTPPSALDAGAGAGAPEGSSAGGCSCRIRRSVRPQPTSPWATALAALAGVFLARRRWDARMLSDSH